MPSHSYTFAMYPKWVTPVGGVPCIVRSEAQEAAVMAPPITSEPPVSERDTLVQEAAALGISFDGRWGASRIKAAIAAEQAAEPPVKAKP